MKKFVLKFSVFTAVFLFCIGSLMALVIIANQQSLTHCKIQPDIDSLMLGDSHTMWAINDSKIPTLRNISVNAEGYKYSLRKLEHVLASGDKPETVYIGFSYHNLSGYYDQYISGRLFRHVFDRYLPVMQLDDYIGLVKSNTDSLADIFRRLVKEGGKKAIKSSCPLFGGFPPQQMHDEYSRESMLKRIDSQYYQDGQVLAPSSSNRKYLAKLIQLCKTNNINVVLVNTPLHKDYLERIPPEYVKIYDTFLKENSVEVYEFADLPLEDHHFLPDGDHINYAGAARVTEAFKAYHEAQ